MTCCGFKQLIENKNKISESQFRRIKIVYSLVNKNYEELFSHINEDSQVMKYGRQNSEQYERKLGKLNEEEYVKYAVQDDVNPSLFNYISSLYTYHETLFNIGSEIGLFENNEEKMENYFIDLNSDHNACRYSRKYTPLHGLRIAIQHGHVEIVQIHAYPSDKYYNAEYEIDKNKFCEEYGSEYLEHWTNNRDVINIIKIHNNLLEEKHTKLTENYAE